MTKIRSITKLSKTLLYSIHLFTIMNIQNVWSSQLYNRLQSVNGLSHTITSPYRT